MPLTIRETETLGKVHFGGFNLRRICGECLAKSEDRLDQIPLLLETPDKVSLSLKYNFTQTVVNAFG
jgi:hypothetical protein